MSVMIPDEIVEKMPDLLRTAIAVADTFRDELIAQYGTEGHGALKLVKARIDRADVAVAVWPDNAAVYKVGYCVLKGARIIREYLATGVPSAHLLGLRRGLARARAERERLTDRLADAIEEIDAECDAVRAELVRRRTFDDDDLEDIVGRTAAREKKKAGVMLRPPF
jgi:hypothetical protein